MPELGLVVLHLMALVQVVVVALLAIPMPWLAALVAWAAERWWGRVEAERRERDPLAHLRG